jgi:CDP-diacylglycerol--glycerol-3-phosphate 3-phosphatidyltransferase
MNIPPELLTVPNLLTAFRILCAPVLLAMAWQGYATAFLLLLALAFLSDVLDGLVARLCGQVSQFGAKLDSWADATLFLTITISAWWLWPEIVRREAVYVGTVIICYLLPAVVGYLKFNEVTSYHTWLVKCAVAATGLSMYSVFLGGPAWPFRLATALCVLAAIEEIAITAVSAKLHSNVRSICNVLRPISRKKQG